MPKATSWDVTSFNGFGSGNEPVPKDILVLSLEHKRNALIQRFCWSDFLELSNFRTEHNRVVTKRLLLLFSEISLSVFRSRPQKCVTIIISVCFFELEDSEESLWISGRSLNVLVLLVCWRNLDIWMCYILFFRSAYWKMDIRPNHTLYINNVNDKIKKDGMTISEP